MISIVALGVSGTRWRAVSQERERAVAELASVRQQATEIGRLRRTLGTQRVATAGSRADALAEIADTLAAAGLPDGAMRSLDEQGEAEVGETDLRRQTLRLALAALTPSELGRFFARLGVDRPQWIVIRIELNRPRREDGNRYDAQLILA
ncbi:MAG: hypothetical protein HRU13_03795, partial [Phycisphaerales bacterium]|nr:hypothetical protein [Phycisphaerales bacterium]